MRAFLRFLIRSYQLLVSPMLGPRCRFHPSCSQYALDAIETHGVARGAWLALRRLLRCHPLHPGGYDPVPAARARTVDPTTALNDRPACAGRTGSACH